MGIPGSANPMLFGGAAAYQINQSLRFDGSSYLTRTPSSNGNRRTWTWSGWIKTSINDTNRHMIFTGDVSNQNLSIEITANQLVTFQFSGSYIWRTLSSAVYRDPSSWYHIVVTLDTTQATASDRLKMYINGGQITSLDIASYPSQNYDGQVNATVAHQISGLAGSGAAITFPGYMAEVNFIDGTALTPSSFGETDTITGAWIPKKYSGSYGTNGFYLKFDPSATNGIGHDHSGNGNNWTASGFVTSGTGTDVMSDTPTNNWCTFNPLNLQGSTLSNGNLNATMPGRSAGTFAVSSGKWYWECTYNAGNGYALGIGIANVNAYYPAEGFSFGVIYYGGDGSKYVLGTNSSYSTSYSGGTFGIALDLNSAQNTIEFFIDGTSKGVINISSGITWTPLVQGGSGSTTGSWDANFGQRAFAYTPPTGFKALNTANLPEPTIKKGSKYFDTKLYTGTDASLTVNYDFSPDFVWIKSRSHASDNSLYDIVRGTNLQLRSNSTNAEINDTNGFNSFNSNGFTLGVDTGDNINAASRTYVAWAWDANGAGSSNTAGSITSTVSANATAGFSIVTYTGAGSNGTVGHGLGVAPKFLIVKNRSSATAYNWYVWHTGLTSASYFLNLNRDIAQTFSADPFNGTAPTSTVFSVGGENRVSSVNYVAYCFSEVAGYSKFGSYTGNGSTDGPFVFCGFRPALIMIKRTNTTGNWTIHDNRRLGYNGSSASKELYPNLSNSEGTDNMDQLSNGFKLRDTYSDVNASGGTYIFAAFSETAFKFANAR